MEMDPTKRLIAGALFLAVVFIASFFDNAWVYREPDIFVSINILEGWNVSEPRASLPEPPIDAITTSKNHSAPLKQLNDSNTTDPVSQGKAKRDEVIVLVPAKNSSCGRTRPVAGVDKEGSKQVIRVAIVLYGMARSACALRNIHDIFVQPLVDYSQDHNVEFVYDIIVDANIAPFSSSVRSHVHNVSVDLDNWRQARPCFYRARNQRETDMAILPMFQAAFVKYGDAWGDATGSTTMNMLRALYSQYKAAELVENVEHQLGKPYDAIVVGRLDVLQTLPIPAEAYVSVIKAQEERKELLFYSPTWHRFEWINDRFFLSERSLALMALRRYQMVEEYLEISKKALHAETFMLWLMGTLGKTPPKEGYTVKVVMVSWVAFRRVRSTGQIIDEMFNFNKLGCDKPCPLFDIQQCDDEVALEHPTCNCSVSHWNGIV